MKKRLKKYFKRLLWVAAILSFAMAVMFPLENWRAERAFREHKTWLEKMREPLEELALAPPAVPDEQNAAYAPVFECFYIKNSQRNREWASSELPDAPPAWSAAQKELAQRWTEWKLACSHIQLIDENFQGQLSLAEALKKSKANWHDPRHSYAPSHFRPFKIDRNSAAPLEEVADYFKLLGNLPEQLRLAAQRPYVRWPTPVQYQILFHPLSAQPVLGLDLQLAVLQADGLRAHADLMAIIRFAESNATGLGISAAVQQAGGWAKCSIGIRHAISARLWNKEQWEAVAKALPNPDLRKFCQTALRMQRAYLLEHLPSDLRGSMSACASDSMGTIKSGVRTLLYLGPEGWIKQNFITSSRQLQEKIDAFDKPPLGSLHDQFCLPEPDSLGVYNFMYMDYSGNMSKAILEDLDSLQLEHVGIALERYRLEHGHFPEKLAELTPALLAAIPVDCFGSKPPDYLRTSDGYFKLWFYGRDRVNHQGDTLKDIALKPMALPK